MHYFFGDPICERDMFPKQDHPLTLAYIAAVRCRSPEDMKNAMHLIRSLERDAPEIIRHQCKLAAEVLLERKHA